MNHQPMLLPLPTVRSRPSFGNGIGYELQDDEIIVDSFAGGGGTSTGIEMALGRSPDIAINHDPVALGLHEANHPDTTHYVNSVYAVNPDDAVPRGKRIGLYWASPDCFVAGTLILTRRGYVPVETVMLGDEVLTHKGRWRRVVETSSKERPVMTVKGHGHPGLTVSHEHPFYTRPRQSAPGPKTWSGEPDWTKASDLGKNHFWATPTIFPEEPMPPVAMDGERGMTIDERLMWLAGRYLADGWLRFDQGHHDIVVTCGHSKTKMTRARLSCWPRTDVRSEHDELAWQEQDTSTAHQFTASHRNLAIWLSKNFGEKAENKKIPVWAFGMKQSMRQALVDGYLAGDGWQGENSGSGIVEYGTVSKALLFGLKSLAVTLGKTVLTYAGKKAGTSIIEGREVKTQQMWLGKWRTNLDPKRSQTFRADDCEWTPIRRTDDDGLMQTVFNIGVEEDESYIAEGIVVHNCRHFSSAKGGAPVSDSVRDLAWVVVHWAERQHPRVICLENVRELLGWGPLLPNGRPDPARKGEEFQKWCNALRKLGYKIEYRILVAADYGVPSTRTRLFIVARLDGLPIRWPEATHGKPGDPDVLVGRKLPWRTAAEIIDFDLPVHSIFLSSAEGKERGIKRPLAAKTERRIARGMFKNVTQSEKPFIVSYYGEKAGGGFRGQPLQQPLQTQTTANRFGLVVPLTHAGDNRVYSAHQALPTVTGANRGELAYVAPTLIQTGYGEREGQAPRVPGLDKPIGTLMAQGQKHGLVAASLTVFNQNSIGKPLTDPLQTVMAGATRHGLLETALEAAPVDRTEEVARFLWDHRELAEHEVKLSEVGSVMVDGQRLWISDIGMRMLAARELFDSMSFPPDYEIGMTADGHVLTKTQQTRLAGNAVAPLMAKAVIEANMSPPRSMMRAA